MKHIRRLLIGAAAVLMLASCSSSKTTLPFFTDISDVKEGVLGDADFLVPIVPDDELSILVTSRIMSATAVYNLPSANVSSGSVINANIAASPITYRVDSKGDIYFPELGRIHVAGMNVEQLRDKLCELLSKHVEDPIVIVQLLNYKVRVAGEVRAPGTIGIKGTRMSILDALASAGDLTEYGERSNVLVIREEDGQRKFAHLDLNSSDLINSPYYYVHQNDYIYVSPNSIRQSNSKYNQNNAFKLSVISTVTSAASVIASLVIALTVK